MQRLQAVIPFLTASPTRSRKLHIFLKRLKGHLIEKILKRAVQVRIMECMYYHVLRT